MSDFPAEAVPASDLIRGGICTPQCLLASVGHSEDLCRCRCKGACHGALADALVRPQADLRPWWERCHRGGWSVGEIESYVPLCKTVRQENAEWKRCKARAEPFLIVTPADRAWRVVHDHGTLPYRSKDKERDGWHGDTATLGARFLVDLVDQHRVGTVGPPPGEHVFALGVRSLDEARMIAAFLGECFAGNHDGITRAICVLEGHRDPLEMGLMPKPYLAALPEPNYHWMSNVRT